PARNFFERKVFFSYVNKLSRSHIRLLSTICAFLIMFVALLLIALLLIPQLFSNYAELAERGEEYIRFAQEFADKIIGGSALFGENSTLTELLGSDLDVFLTELLVDSFLFADKFVSSILSIAGGFVDFAVTAVFSLICAFGIMLYSDVFAKYLNRICAVIFTPRQNEAIRAALVSLDRAFGGFFSGRIFESLIIGGIALVIFYLTRMPYPPLLAVILAVFNLIPYFGSIFAGVVGGVLVIVADPSKLIWFLVIDLVMEQIDGNILAPRVLGDSVGMHPLCIIASITVMGNLLGVVGLIVGVPLASVCMDALRYLCVIREEKKKKGKEKYEALK
ncbi:MAG: AI-2E family transporter, partial [Clostridia bacterium]|nr:AI-2E family transporter [Clostridia bacterium]